jgi:hypothetical protein
MKPAISKSSLSVIGRLFLPTQGLTKKRLSWRA